MPLRSNHRLTLPDLSQPLLIPPNLRLKILSQGPTAVQFGFAVRPGSARHGSGDLRFTPDPNGR